MGNYTSRQMYSTTKVKGFKKFAGEAHLEVIVDEWWRMPKGAFVEVLLLAKKIKLEDICLYKIFLKKKFETTIGKELEALGVPANPSFTSRTNEDWRILCVLLVKVRFADRNVLGEPSFTHQVRKTVLEEIEVGSDTSMGNMRALVIGEVTWSYINFFSFMVMTPIPVGQEGLRTITDYFVEQTEMKKLVFKKKNCRFMTTMTVVQDCLFFDNNRKRDITFLTWKDTFEVLVLGSGKQIFKQVMYRMLREPLMMNRLLFGVRARQCCDTLGN